MQIFSQTNEIEQIHFQLRKNFVLKSLKYFRVLKIAGIVLVVMAPIIFIVTVIIVVIRHYARRKYFFFQKDISINYLALNIIKVKKFLIYNEIDLLVILHLIILISISSQMIQAEKQVQLFDELMERTRSKHKIIHELRKQRVSTGRSKDAKLARRY